MGEDKPKEEPKPQPEAGAQPDARPQQASRSLEMSISRKYIAELLGTLALVFFGCGSVVVLGGVAQVDFAANYLRIAFAFGIVVLVMVYALGPISGCHINPAITVGMLATKRISPRDALAYIIAQCVGAFIGAALVLAIMSGHPGYTLDHNGLGQNGYGHYSPLGYNVTSAFLAELLLTFFFLMVIFGVTAKKATKGFEGIAIGLTLFIIHIVGIPITGTSVNPARSLGPAIFVGGAALEQLWLFWLAPILGAIIAAVVWKMVLEPAHGD